MVSCHGFRIKSSNVNDHYHRYKNLVIHIFTSIFIVSFLKNCFANPVFESKSIAMKINKIFRLPILMLIMPFTLMNAKESYAQDVKHHEHDSTFYEIFWHHVTVRTFLAQKYTHFTIPPDGGGTDLQYVANPKLGLGVGVTYHNLSANAFYGFGYLNNKAKPKGETKGLDLQ